MNTPQAPTDSLLRFLDRAPAGSTSLRSILELGYELSVVRGKLKVFEPMTQTYSSMPRELVDHVLSELSAAMGTPIYQYQKYSTGRYPHKGVTLSFRDLRLQEQAYTIFNVELTRARTTKHGKAGSPLPKGRFRALEGSKFLKFWRTSGMKLRPGRYSEFHEHMGGLGPVAFVAEMQSGNRLIKDSVLPLEMTHEELTQTLDNSRTTLRQLADNTPTTVPDKDFLKNQQRRGNQPISATCARPYETSNQVNTVQVSTLPPLQSVDEWLADYCRGHS